MNRIFSKTLALSLSASLLAVSVPGFAAERQVIDDTQTITDTFENLSYTGYGGALSITSTADVTVTGSTFENNSATKGGAAIDNEGTLQINSSQFAENSTDGRGGALSALGDIVIDNSVFNSNTAAGVGGGAIFQFSDPNATLSIHNTSFQGNSTVGSGGAIYSVDTLAITNSTFEANQAGSYGGALIIDGTVTIEDSIFSNNSVQGSETTEGQGGAILQFLNHTAPGTLTVKNTVFQGNHANSNEATGGAVDIYSHATFDNVTFNQNSVTANHAISGGGAVHVGAESVVAFNNSTFTQNTAAYGGAIRTRDATLANNAAALLDITNSTFISNSADSNGGAFYNNFYNSATTGDSVYIANTIFKQNMAAVGGAIYNDGTVDKADHSGALFIKDSTFAGNSASGNGGAIYNGGMLILSGINTFTGNTATTGNDIYNTGMLTIEGTTALDGGISGTGNININGILDIGQATVQADTLLFANGSTLGVTLGNDAKGNLEATNITVGTSENDRANLQVLLSKDFSSTGTIEHALTNDTVVANGKFALADVSNALYNVSFDDTTNVVTAQRKSTQEQNQAVQSVGGNSNDATVMDAYTSVGNFGNDKTNQVADIINTLAQTDIAAMVAVTKTIAPEAAPSKQVVQTTVLGEVFGAMQNRMTVAAAGASPSAYALGDKNYQSVDENYFSVWTQGLLNKSHKEATAAAGSFTGRSTGISTGADMKISEDTLAGIGYAYTHTNVSSTGRHDRILGNNFFVYSQYRPSDFYLQGSLAYGDSKYEEAKYLPGLKLNANYHVQNYSAQALAGYDVFDWLSPNVALRYTRLHQEGYSDGAQNVSANNANYLTGILGTDMQTELRATPNMSFWPRLHVGLAYDFVSDDNNSHVTLPNATSYSVVGERLHRLACEVGAGVATRLYNDFEISAGYEGSFRQDYNAHTGTLKLRYLF